MNSAASRPGIRVDAQAMRAAALQGYATATDLADYLVRRGVAFRDAHEAVGQAVRHAAERGLELSVLGVEELRRFCAHVGPDVTQALTLEGSVDARAHIGGTAPGEVRRALARAKRRLAAEAAPARRQRPAKR